MTATGTARSAATTAGAQIELRGYTAEQTVSYVRSWFGDVVEDPAERLWPFARTGGDGSMAALWLDPGRVTRIAHLGSGSGSLLTCVLADNGLDFLRLLAIGYEEICWNDEFAAPPRPLEPPWRYGQRPLPRLASCNVWRGDSGHRS